MARLISKRASAGAGKTFALAIRYLDLLHELGEPSPEKLRQIVAITFTNKAAAEMRERILQFLKEITFETEFYQNSLKNEVLLSPREASLWIEIILMNYFDFHVRTIDSLLVAILGGLSFELGIKPELKVLFKEVEVLNEAFDILLSYLGEKKKKFYQEMWKKVLTAYLSHDERGGFYPESGLRKRIVKHIYPRLKGEIPNPICPPEVKKKELEETFEELKSAYANLYAFLKEHENALSRIRINNFPLPEEASSNFFLKLLKNKSLMEGEAIRIFRRGNIKSNDLETFELIRAEFREKYNKWLEKYMEFAYVKLAGYYDLIKSLKQQTEEISKKEGLLLGSKHWTELILEVMREESIPPLVYAHFAAEFNHFLFDEFQDTSVEQWEALYPIFADVLSYTEKGGTLFLVGDSKQAIYGWRGGDWKLYHRIFVQREFFPFLEKEHIKEETLKENHRSHPHLVSFFNFLFEDFSDVEKLLNKKITTSKSSTKSFAQVCLGEGAPYEIQKEFCKNLAEAFKDCQQEPAGKNLEKNFSYFTDKPRINIFEVGNNQASKDEVVEVIKEYFLERISEEWEKWKDLTEKVPIAVLVRTNDIGEEVSSWLIQRGLPVVTENALRIGISPVVRGIVSLLYCLQEPEVELYYYGFLASGLFPEGPKSENELVSIWFDKIKREKIKKKVLDLIKKLDEKISGRDPYQLIWVILDELKLEKRLLEELSAQKPFIDRLLEVTHQFVIEEGPSLPRFLNFWEKGGLEARIGLPENIKAIRVLTIHKAKGLEFPVVFIPFTDWQIRDLSPIDVVCYNGDHEKKCLVHLKEPLPDELILHRYKLIAKEIQEEIHLFYVALTRAREKLYLFLPMYKHVGLTPLCKWIKHWIIDAIKKCEKENIFVEYHTNSLKKEETVK